MKDSKRVNAERIELKSFMMRSIFEKYWKKGWIAGLLIAGAYIYLSSVTWLKWGSLIIDTGRELNAPWKLLLGKLLYKDIVYEYGPFSPYFNALLCKIFGIHIRSFVISGLLTIAVLSALLYKISRIFLSVCFSIFSVITFLLVFVFGQQYFAGIFNFVIPYNYSATHSIALAIIALFLYYRVLERKKGVYAYLCGFFTMLTLITRMEVGVMLLLSIFLGIALGFKTRDNFKTRFKIASILCLLPVLAAGAIYTFFSIITENTANINNVGDINLFINSFDPRVPFSRELMGIRDLSKNIILILTTISYYLGISILFFTAGWMLSLVRRAPLIKKILAAIGAVLLVAGVVLFQRKLFPYHMQYRCVPLISILVCIIAYRRYLAGEEQKKTLFLTVFSLFSGLLLIRMLFNVWPGHYGFYLLVPGMLCYYFFFLRIIPEIFTKPRIRSFYRFAFVVVSISFIISHATVSSYAYRYRTLEISSPRGSMRVYPRFYRCKQLLDYLGAKEEPSASLVVFPEGSTLNFLSKMENPTNFYSFLPPMFLSSEFEGRVIESLEDKNVRYVVILARDTSEYGAARFGIDYAYSLNRYITDNYIIEQRFGPLPFTSNEFSLVLLRRKDQ